MQTTAEESRSESVGLVDCGDARRLDGLGPHLIDRPAPAASRPRRDPGSWSAADIRFHRGEGGRAGWTVGPAGGDPWTVGVAGLTLELRLAAGGQVGLFLEQIALWDVVRRLLAGPGSARVLNLFAYTGGTSLAAASTGARVAHLDASRTAVAWARRNAALSGLADAPIRWLVDDAEAFVRREGRRGSTYDLVVLDPPSFGHGARRATWRLDERLPGLLRGCASLLDRSGRILISSHTPGYGPDRLAAEAMAALATPAAGRLAGAGTAGTREGSGRPAAILESGPLDVRAASGAVLPAGAYALLAAG